MSKSGNTICGGFAGKILRVNLTNSKISEEELPVEIARDYIGGSGINAKLLFDALIDNINVSPLSPDNPLIFGAGPLVGTKFPCATRYTVTSKSPLTGIFRNILWHRRIFRWRFAKPYQSRD